MDIILFFIGLLALFFKRRDYTLAIIVILSSTYLQLPLQPKFAIGWFPIEHNISDMGLLLYLFVFMSSLFGRKVHFRGKLQNAVTIFLLYLLINGIFDVCSGTSLGDFVRYLKGWTYLSLIYIYQDFSPKEVINSLRIVCRVTFGVCLVILVTRVFGIDSIHNILIEKGSRGFKPPSFSIICSVIYILNFFRTKLIFRLCYIIVFLTPILLNVKMTYFISIALIVVVYLIIIDKFSTTQKLGMSLVCIISIVVLFTVSDTFNTRFVDLSTGINSASQGDVEDNFSYRLLHSAERFRYISEEPSTLLRGIGYVSETNFNETAFELGVWNPSMKRVDQLNNGDIVWSNLFLRLGLIGIFLYLLMYVRIISSYIKWKNASRRNPIFISYLVVSLVFTSLGNDLIGYSDFFIFPILFLNNQLLTTNEYDT